jgi:SAM-dependent methyltransferase/uncharacterized protein YbaR (Trm112 family)
MGPLELSIHDASVIRLSEEHRALAIQRGVLDDDFPVFVETAVLLCPSCRAWFPVVRGLPVLLPYATMAHAQFAREVGPRLPAGYAAPGGSAAPGERLVMTSFSTEWATYRYDGVIWEMNYAHHEERFLRELGVSAHTATGLFLELGCGLGVTTFLAQRNFRTDAVGVDLSLAAMRATAQFRTNPFVHFVQASVFGLPFERQTFQLVYTHGVLHHTYSTERAFKALAECCQPGGVLYVWVYGPGSVGDNVFRRMLYIAERMIRWTLNRSGPWVTTPTVRLIAFGYLAYNRSRHWCNPRIAAYNYERAVHAARDRFTPEYAHRHDSQEVGRWFAAAGYESIEVVDWRTMPAADHEDYRRNTGVRGRRAAR